MDKQFRVKLIVKRAPTLAAISWLKQSWVIFMQAPMTWLLMFITIGAIALVGQLHPLAAVISILLNPFLTAGVYKSVVMLQQKQPITFTDLFKPLSESDCRAVFLRIAALNVLASIPLSSLAMTLMQQHEAQQSVDALMLMLFVVSFLVSWMVFAYAVAIAYFLKEYRILAIIKASFIACWRNIVPLVVFGLLSLLLIMLTMPTLFIGLLLVVPVLNIAFFLSFNEFFALQVKATDDGVLEI
ncbi:hypothetical protein ORJ04_12985 [Rheinheimera baltica]|uniref:DUF624 domain-containing protein n=1 Tax=Rheinheimera baltica TaxID=67576 RepID=A0ABT9I104_9GAMM|nr:hypothetical protein [Rheinheimera baltica]MDP5136863.1 hypothetical protein [Rheinheimera baltica]MDP5143925.1 hypothetical protein [Rheinheimera baltica]MDP5151647.1 hypothetical protein [Rheinheimera baltica]